jgi:hypothetical protein
MHAGRGEKAMTARQRHRIRAAALRRSLASNFECQRVLRGRPISIATLALLKQHFERQPGAALRNHVLGIIGALIRVQQRLSLSLIAGGLTRGHIMAKAVAEAEAHFRDTALREVERLIRLCAPVLSGEDVGDPVDALPDLAMLQMILDEMDRLEHTK